MNMNKVELRDKILSFSIKASKVELLLILLQIRNMYTRNMYFPSIYATMYEYSW